MARLRLTGQTDAMRLFPYLLLSVCACAGSPDTKNPTDDDDSGIPPLDVTERLGAGEVRAGPIVNGGGLFGGVSAEGREGDFKLYNANVQFVVQGVREGDYYEAWGGGLIDADLVREPGEPGRDVVDECGVMVGIGRLVSPSAVTVVADGSDGQAAVIRVEGSGAPMTLLEGALESDAIVADMDVTIVTEYRLEPDSHLLEATTSVSWNDVSTPVQVGDLVMAGMEAVDSVQPGRGLEGGELDGTGEWMGLVGRQNEVAVGIFSEGINFSTGAVETLLSEIGPVLVPLGPSETLAEGDTTTWTRTIGVGPDLATLTDAWSARMGHSTQQVGGTVTTEDGTPVAGARVHLLDGDSLETIAFSGADGSWSAQVRSASPTAVATGRGHGEVADLPAGAGWLAPYVHDDVLPEVLDSFVAGATPIPFAEGYGMSETVAAGSSTELTLSKPGTLRVEIADGGPAMVRVDFAAGDSSSMDRARTPGRPGGAMVNGWVRDGDIDLPVEPGDYLVTVHRGPRFEVVQETVTVAAGDVTSMTASLELAIAPDGFLALDPHSHASPSGDGEITMAHRLLTMASNGVQVHFGTDHDHVADYMPLLEALGLSDVMTTVMANEASPVLRGHTNVYPVARNRALPNAGAPRWWDGITDTESWYDTLRTWAGPDAIIQLNHPAGSSGMLGTAGYSIEQGGVQKPDHFATDFQAIEALNDGEAGEFTELYLDLVSRGYVVTPTGVSDAHGYRNGVGENMTWLPVGVDEPAQLTNALLSEKMRERNTIVSRGPFVDVRIGGMWAPGQTFVGTQQLDVDVTAPSWIVVDTVALLKNGAEVESVAWEGSPVSFELDPREDAHYEVVVSGAEPMAPVYSQTPWAMSAALFVDVDGGGWEPPLPALTMGL